MTPYLTGSFDRIESGLLLPSCGIFVEWGALAEPLVSSASESGDWLPAGQTERYGKLRWMGECCLPLPKDTPPWEGLTGDVLAFTRGYPLKVRSFLLWACDRSAYKTQAAQHELWISSLTKRFGEPASGTALSHHGQVAPTRHWKIGEVSISVSYGWVPHEDEPTVSVQAHHHRHMAQR